MINLIYLLVGFLSLFKYILEILKISSLFSTGLFKKKLLLLLVIIIFDETILQAQNFNDISTVEKTGWLLYKDGHAIWFESDIKNTVQDKAFFNKSKYLDGLIVDYLPIVNYYKSISKCYIIKELYQVDTIAKEPDYTLTDSICILPVKVKFKKISTQISELLKPMGLSFKRGRNEITIAYNFESNYTVYNLKLLRKKDKKKIMNIKKYISHSQKSRNCDVFIALLKFNDAKKFALISTQKHQLY